MARVLEHPPGKGPCVFGDVLSFVAAASAVQNEDFVTKKQTIFSSPIRAEQWCDTHTRVCCVPHADLDCSGLPCVDNSRIKRGRMMMDGPTNSVFIIWALRVKRYKIKVAILENTPDTRLQGFSESVLAAMCARGDNNKPYAKDLQVSRIYPLLSDSYDMWQIFSDMSHVGHSGAARARTYVIFARKDRVVLRNPQVLYDLIAGRISQLLHTSPRDYLTADAVEVDLEAAEVARSRKILHRPGRLNLTYLLNQRERSALRQLNASYKDRFKQDPCQDEDLCYFLGDDPSWSQTWSATSRKIPTLRRNSCCGKLWFPAAKRWMTAAEKHLRFN